MKQTLNTIVSDLRSEKPSQRSVDIASAFLISTMCFYKGHPYSGVVNPLVPASELDECFINSYDNLTFNTLQSGKNIKDIPPYIGNDRILMFNHISGIYTDISVYTVVQKLSDNGLYLPYARISYDTIKYGANKGYLNFLPVLDGDDSGEFNIGEDYPMGCGVYYSSSGFNYLTTPDTLADYLLAIDKVDGGFSDVNSTLSRIAEAYDASIN